MSQGKEDVVLIDVPDEAWLADFGKTLLLRHCILPLLWSL
jgi:hypothetical protein